MPSLTIQQRASIILPTGKVLNYTVASGSFSLRRYKANTPLDVLEDSQTVTASASYGPFFADERIELAMISGDSSYVVADYPGQAATAPGGGATDAAALYAADLSDVTVSGTSGQLTIGKTNNVVGSGAYTSPALPGTVGTPPARFSVRNTGTTNSTLTLPNESGSSVTVTILPNNVLTFRQKSTTGWGVESGYISLSSLDARYSVAIPWDTTAPITGSLASIRAQPVELAKIICPALTTGPLTINLYANTANSGTLIGTYTFTAAGQSFDVGGGGSAPYYSFLGVSAQVTAGTGTYQLVLR